MNIIPLHNEHDVLQRVASGDETAFEQLFHHYRNKLYAVAAAITGVPAVGEDVVQEVFLKVWSHRQQLPEVQNFTSWLYTITRNHIYSGLRKVAYEYDFLQEVLQQDADSTSPVLQQVNFRELQNRLHRIVSALPPQQQRVYLLSREAHLSYAEIATRLQIAPSTVKSHMMEALRTIRQQLADSGVPVTLPVVIMAGAQFWN